MIPIKPTSPDQRLPRVVIIGGGFGGMAAAKALRNAPARILIIDRSNYHLFQPLLYEVAACMLDEGDIAFPIRSEFRNQKNTIVAMAEVTGIDKDKHLIFIRDVDRAIEFDYLILATGVEGSYFGHDEWSHFAPGMKTIKESLTLRSRILKAFEQAELQEDPTCCPEVTTFVIIGGGPTGCELAGTLAEMFRLTLKGDFRRFNPETARIILIEAGPRILPMFSPALSEKARVQMEKMGVEVLLGHAVEQVDSEGVVVSGERIRSQHVIWAAGMKGTPASSWLGVETDRAGRIKVGPDLTIPGYPEIFVVGDGALIMQDGRPLPGVAPVAMQSGKYAGRMVARRLSGTAEIPPFRYFDKGTLATIGRNFAMLEFGRLRLTGRIAKIAWAFVHIFYLMQNEDRLAVFLKWTYAYLTNRRGARLIEEPLKGGQGR